jgi:hypothetical protein
MGGAHRISGWHPHSRIVGIGSAFGWFGNLERLGPGDHSMTGRELRFEALEHGRDYNDDTPQAIRVIDPQGRSAIYRPIMEGGK